MGFLDYFDQFVIDQTEDQRSSPRGRTGTGIVDRRLGERSFLNFRFPTARGTGAPSLSIMQIGRAHV